MITRLHRLASSSLCCARTRVALASVPLIAASLACGPMPVSAPEAELWARFPDRAARVVEDGPGFAPAESGGFAIAFPHEDARRALGGLDVHISETGAVSVDVDDRVHDRVHLRVVEEGTRARPTAKTTAAAQAAATQAAATMASASVSVPRDDGGASYWSVQDGGVEEWLLVERPAPGVVARWTIDGAAALSASDDGTGVVVHDDTGDAVLTITAPEGFTDDDDIRFTPSLVIEGGATVALVLPDAVAGHDAVLVDPFWKTLQAMPVARWAATGLLLPDGSLQQLGGHDASSGAFGAVMPPAALSAATSTWATRSSPCAYSDCLAEHTGVVLGDGSAFFVGGQLTDEWPWGWRYDVAADTYTTTGYAYSQHYSNNESSAQEATSTRLANNRVLFVGGQENLQAGPPVTSCVDCSNPYSNQHGSVFDPVTSTYVDHNTGVARARHTATLLADGRVLIVGGIGNNSTILASAQIYNPSTDTFTAAAPMSTAREWHTATLLHDGRVLVVGGMNLFSMTSVEIYNPSNNTWTAGPSLAGSRARHTATLLPDGRVLVTGGKQQTFVSSTYLASTEIYSPSSNTWSAGPTLAWGRDRHTATLMADGTVVVAGGRGTFFGSDIALTSTQSLNLAIQQHPNVGQAAPNARRLATATTMQSGRVLLAGGEQSGTASATAARYDASALTFTATGAMTTARRRHTSTLLNDGTVLVVGGENGAGGALGSTERYDDTAGTFAPATATTPRFSHSATLLEDGDVLVCGGTGSLGTALSSCDRYRQASSSWAPMTSMAAARSGQRAVLLLDSRVLVVGGNAGATTAAVYDAGANAWSDTGALVHDHGADFAVALLPSGKVLACGGDTAAADWTSACDLYNPATNTWVDGGNLYAARRRFSMNVLPSGRVLMSGGANPDLNPAGSGLTFLEEYDPASATFTGTLIDWPQADYGAAELLGGDILIAAGELNDNLDPSPPLASTYTHRYDEGRGAPAGLFGQRPTISAAPATAAPSSTITVSGSRFTGNNREATGGAYNDAATNFPLLVLHRLDNQAHVIARTTSFTSGTASFALPASLQRGTWLARVVVNGSNSDAVVIKVQ